MQIVKNDFSVLDRSITIGEIYFSGSQGLYFATHKFDTGFLFIQYLIVAESLTVCGNVPNVRAAVGHGGQYRFYLWRLQLFCCYY